MNDFPPIEQPCGGPALTTLRRLDAGELPDPERTGVQAHVDACDRCQSVLRDFAGDLAAARIALPFVALEARLERRPRLAGRLWSKLAMAIALPVAALAGVMLMVRAPESDVRVKGAALEYAVKTADGARDGKDGEALHPGDVIRLRYDASNRPWVLIVGVDADGAVFPYLSDGDRSAPAAAVKAFAPGAVALDDDPRPERIFALFSSEPIGVDELKPAARDALKAVGGRVEALRTLPLGLANVEQATLLLNKASE